MLSMLCIDFAFLYTYLTLQFVDRFLLIRLAVQTIFQFFVLQLQVVEVGQIFLHSCAQVVQVALKLEHSAFCLRKLLSQCFILECDLCEDSVFDLIIN